MFVIEHLLVFRKRKHSKDQYNIRRILLKLYEGELCMARNFDRRKVKIFMSDKNQSYIPQLFAVRPKTVPSSELYRNVAKSENLCLTVGV